MKLRPIIIYGSLAVSSLLLIALIVRKPVVSEPEIQPNPIMVVPIEEPIVDPQPFTEIYTVKKGDFLGTIFPKFGIPVHETHQAAIDIFDLAKIRVGKDFSFIKPTEESVSYTEVHYPIDKDSTLILTKKDSKWVANKKVAQYDKKQEHKKFTVTGSFWQSASDVGLNAANISGLVQLFEYDIDFNTEIRSNGSVRMVIDSLHQNNDFVRYDAPKIIEFINNNETYIAIRYTTKDGKSLYYDEKGVSRKGAFLRSPLAFSRVTSRFNPKRFHPILKRKVPHNGTDFGAPTGTPVRAASNGTVTYAGSNGGHGKFVKIKHASGYDTSYSHLSKILVRKGNRVKQGTVIGKVGTTGRSTGPHLHYQMWKNGRFVDALKEKLPKTQSIPKDEITAFLAHQEKLKALLNQQ